MQRLTLKIFLLFYILLITSVFPQGRTIGIFVDGGYSPGKKDTEMDKLLDKRVQDAMDAMKDKDKNSDTSKVEHKADLKKKLENLHCKCGDEVVLYLIGHGEGGGGKSNYSFHFTKDESEVTPDELRRWLDTASDECCCKISVVIFSCHSGAFLDELFNAEHVVSVFTSSGKTELSYSDAYRSGGKFVDGGDWSDGFNKDWKASKKKNMVDILIESAASAKEKMPDKFSPKEHPQGWVRGEFEIFGHVEGVRKDEKGEKIVKLKVHFYEPDFLRCTTKEIKVDGVNVPAGIK
ncbi:MAG TPA: C13 family peptidase, partial [Ignavibacteriaceae bacterium]|nr:C13 family peptidase [Ignavibacteriaceae bacterium]